MKKIKKQKRSAFDIHVAKHAAFPAQYITSCKYCAHYAKDSVMPLDVLIPEAQRIVNSQESGIDGDHAEVVLELCHAVLALQRELELQPRQGLTERDGVPVFAIVFTPDDIASETTTVEEAATLLRNHADKYVDGFLNNEWKHIVDVVTDCVKGNEAA